MFYVDFESILKLVDERYRDKMNQLKVEREGKVLYMEKFNIYVLLGWCVYSKFVYGEVFDLMMVYCGEDCVEQFVDYLEKEVKRLYEFYLQQFMVELIEVLKREYEVVEECYICWKLFGDFENCKVRDYCYYMGFYCGVVYNNCNMKYRIFDFVFIVFYNFSGYDVYLFIKEFGKKFNNDDIGVIVENKEKYISFSVKIKVKFVGVFDKEGK